MMGKADRSSVEFDSISSSTNFKITNCCRQEYNGLQANGELQEGSNEIINVTECESSIEVISSPGSSFSCESDRDVQSREQM